MAPPKKKTATASEQIEAQLVRAALEKRKRGQTPTVRETNALRKWERQQEESRRREYYASVPKSHYLELASKKATTLHSHADLYGLPLRGDTIDLYAVVSKLHDLLVRHGRQMMEDPDDPMTVAVNSPALERWREERAKMARMDRLEREQALLPREYLHEGLTRIAGVLRSAGELLAQKYDDDARAILDTALDNASREIESFFAGPEDDAEDP